MKRTSNSAANRLAKHGVTQTDLALLLGRTQPSLSLALSGQRKFAEGLETIIAALLAGKGMEPEDALNEASAIRRIAESPEGLA